MQTPKTTFLAALLATVVLADDCSFFQDLQCKSGDQTNQPADWANRTWQTPLPGSADWKPEFQGYGRVQCYNNIVYAADRQSAQVEARCRKHESITEVTYNWNDEGFVASNTYAATSKLTEALSLTVKAKDDKGTEFTITLEAPNFIFQNPEIV